MADMNTSGAATAVSRNVNMVSEGGTDRIKIGLIGCGGRGTGAVDNCMSADPTVTVVAVADLFENKAKKAAQGFKNKFKDRCQIKDDQVFWGFDAYKKLVACDLKIVLMATAPVFRPYHLRAAIDAGKSVFMEKPVAVDPGGCRRVIEASKLAEQKGLGIVCGTQRRHSANFLATMEQIHQGAIGDLIGGQCYWCGEGIWYRGPSEGMTELEWQCHNWYHFTWLSGDQICEQHIHNIDVLNWCFQGPPAKFMGTGGRWTRPYEKEAREASIKLNGNDSKAELYRGDIYCHIGTEMEYPNGARALSMGRHQPGSGRGGERIVGTKGVSDCCNKIWAHDGTEIWKHTGRGGGGMVEEHADLIKSLKAGKPLNEGIRIAESTLTAVGCRMSAFTGREFSWDWLLKTSKLDYLPPELEKELKPGPGIFHPVAIPGKEALI
jgi:predicted dehydrogenase